MNANESPLHELTAFQRDLLTAIMRLDDPSGLDAKRALEAAYDTSMTHGRVYPALAGLVEDGLLAKRVLNSRRHAYEVTEHGRRRLVGHNDWQSNAIHGDA